MTHYEIDYSSLSPQAKHEQAIQDIKDYLGADRYAKITADAKQMSPKTVEQWGYYLILAGISGYPVNAWQAEIWPYG